MKAVLPTHLRLLSHGPVEDAVHARDAEDEQQAHTRGWQHTHATPTHQPQRATVYSVSVALVNHGLAGAPLSHAPSAMSRCSE